MIQKCFCEPWSPTRTLFFVLEKLEQLVLFHMRDLYLCFCYYCGYWFEVAESDIIYSHALIRNSFVVAAKDVFMIIACLVIYTGM